MFIKKIKFEKHPLIGDSKSFVFSVPHRNNIGSGINYIVGKSGSGKTKFLEMFFLMPIDPTKPGNPRIDDNQYSIKLFDESCTEITSNPIAQEPAPVRRFKLKYSFIDGRKEPKKHYMFSSEETLSRDISGRQTKRKESVDRFKNKYEKDSRNSGKGEARFDSIMSEIGSVREDTGVVIVEEPEAFLDPINQKILLKRISEVAKEKQVFITTHSPYMVDWSYLCNGASIFKVNRPPESSESIVGAFCNAMVAEQINNPMKRQPHLKGVETKDIFFADKVFIVEGQEDVGLISRYLADNNMDYDFVFFGYGAGGADKIKNVLKLCSDLKILKVAALFDKESKDADRVLRYTFCFEKYAPAFQIEELVAEDIRDKFREDEKGKLERYKEGAFTEDGDLKQGKLGDDFKTKIKNILDYFKGDINDSIRDNSMSENESAV